MTSPGINNADLFMCSTDKKEISSLILSRDHIAFFFTDKPGDLMDCVDLSGKGETSSMKNNFERFSSLWTASAAFNRKALIGLLQCMDSEKVVLHVGDDCPVTIEGGRKGSKTTALLAPIIDNGEGDE